MINYSKAETLLFFKLHLEIFLVLNEINEVVESKQNVCWNYYLSDRYTMQRCMHHLLPRERVSRVLTSKTKVKLHDNCLVL